MSELGKHFHSLIMFWTSAHCHTMIQMNNTVIKSIRGNETVIIRMPKDNTVVNE